jgi:hypothetical protein
VQCRLHYQAASCPGDCGGCLFVLVTCPLANCGQPGGGRCELWTMGGVLARCILPYAVCDVDVSVGVPIDPLPRDHSRDVSARAGAAWAPTHTCRPRGATALREPAAITVTNSTSSSVSSSRICHGKGGGCSGNGSAAVPPGTGPGRRSPGSVSSRRPTAAAAGSGHWQIQGSVHMQPHGRSSCTALQQQACGRRAPGKARGSRGCDCAADGRRAAAAPKLREPTRPPHRRLPDSGSCSR